MISSQLSRLVSSRLRPCVSSATCRLRLASTASASGQQSSPKSQPTEVLQVDTFQSRDFFEVHKLFTIGDLFRARVHLGHTPRASKEEMKPFIYGHRFDTAIINLDETALLLRQALNFLAQIAYRGGIVLFVARQPQLVHLVEKTAIEAGEYAHCRPWKHEILTASKVLFRGEVRHPDAIVFLHTRDGTRYEEHPAIIDAAKLNIPTVAIVDTDCNPNIITYPIPGNDDTLEAQQLYLHLFKQAVLIGKRAKSGSRDDANS